MSSHSSHVAGDSRTRMLYLVRHGAARGTEGRCVGHHDVPLSDDGVDAVRRLARRWRAPWPTHVVSSDLARARQSAQLLADRFGVTVHTDARLRELHFGRWEGTHWCELETRDGVALNAWMAAWETARVPEGESYGDVVMRVASWLEDVSLSSHASLAVVAHAGSIRALLVHTLGVPRRTAFSMRLDTAHVSAIRVTLSESARGGSVIGAELCFLNADRVFR